MQKKVIYAAICLIACMELYGCSKTKKMEDADWKEYTTMPEETSTKQEEPTIAMTKEEIFSYSNDLVTWGPGIQMGEDQRPVACVAFQEKYATLGAEFLKENEKVVYLTFDEGYENGYTAQILDVLKEKNVSAVFFVTMPYAKEETELMKRFVEEGHVIGNHSVSHPSGGMPSLSVEEQVKEYQELHEYVKNTYQYEMYLFRPPAGIFSEQSLATGLYSGYRTVMWSFAYADWDPDNQPSKDTALQKMEGRLHCGAIYLLHAVSETNASVLGEFIDYVRSQGYEFKKYE